MNRIYLFDVDGTLTPPRMPMDKKFAEFFNNFANSNKVFLVSGSNYKKIQEQIPPVILNKCEGIYGCSGAEHFVNSLKVYSKAHSFTDELRYLCRHFVQESAFQLRTGNHIEERPGMLNISSVGRNANEYQRKAYHSWDSLTKERLKFIDLINESNLGYEASAGGEISIDIVPSGWNKSVVKDEVLNKFPYATLIFFGDRIIASGNDLPLAQALKTPVGKHFSKPVSSYFDTWRLLESDPANLTYEAA